MQPQKAEGSFLSLNLFVTRETLLLAPARRT